MQWRIHHKAETQSTNLDARAGAPGDVFTADYQSAGRGRLDHKWHSAPGANLMMSVVLSVADLPPEQVATLPLVAGLAVIDTMEKLVSIEKSKNRKIEKFSIKWPNDILFAGRKLAGILCERHGDAVIVGIGVNVNQRDFPPDIATRATSLSLILNPSSNFPQSKNRKIEKSKNDPNPSSQIVNRKSEIRNLRSQILSSLSSVYLLWKSRGLSPFLDRLAAVDCLRGQTLRVMQTDTDTEPLVGRCDGIAPDGSLLVAGRPVYAGEAHILYESTALGDTTSCRTGRSGWKPLLKRNF